MSDHGPSPADLSTYNHSRRTVEQVGFHIEIIVDHIPGSSDGHGRENKKEEMQVIELRNETIYSKYRFHDKESHHILGGSNDEQILKTY